MGESLFQYLFIQAPMMIAAIGCIVAASILWHRAPFASALLIAACGVSILAFLVYPVAFKAAVGVLGADAASVRRINNAFGFFWSVFRAVYLVVLVFAIYSGRKTSVPTSQ